METGLLAFMAAGYLAVSLFVLNVPSDNFLMNTSIVILALIALYLRYKGIRSTFQNKTTGFLELGGTVLSHIVLFALLFILFRDDYTIPDPTNVLVDSFFYSTDTTTTNGASGITPKSGITKGFHILNILDSYLLILTLGTFIIRRIDLKTN